ncbi:MAG: hypothetical protein JHC26_03280 [Thermofilum sp.]|jgi:hypothetical protein|uniref:hypothetical protein n=1 Tax=Thermofilum sp. TaxID=1961369 RepID=UPI00258A2562|nr:hypothetical protein [Thermofilum sp.]MCI4408091.1 hypothetical protein [Thermofilum sp.]
MSERISKKLGVFGQIRDYIKTIDPAVVSEIEDATEDELVANLYTSGFDWVILGEIQRIAKANNVRVGFSVEPYSQTAIKLILVISEVAEE